MLDPAIPLIENPGTVRNSRSIVPQRAPVKAASHVADRVSTPYQPPSRRVTRPDRRKNPDGVAHHGSAGRGHRDVGAGPHKATDQPQILQLTRPRLEAEIGIVP